MPAASRLLGLAADIDLARRIVADEHDREARHRSTAGQRSPFASAMRLRRCSATARPSMMVAVKCRIAHSGLWTSRIVQVAIALRAARSSAPCPSCCAAARSRTRRASGSLYFASRCSQRRAHRCVSSSAAPCAATTTAVTPSPKSGCGTPMTALSATPGSASISVSTSIGIDVVAAADDQVLAAADDEQ